VTSRTYAPDYVGSRGRITLSAIERLSPLRYAVQPKLDGIYATVRTGDHGQVTTVRTRTGRVLSPRLHGLRGQIVGPPRSLLVGELAAWSPGGIATADAAGYVVCELHDLLIDAGERLHDRPYRERRDRLWRAHARLEHDGVPRRGWIRDRRRRRHDATTGRYVDEQIETALNWGRAPIVEQLPPARVGDIWRRVGLVPWVEGVVVVALDAPVARRGAKRKCKPRYTEDCTVLEVTGRSATVQWRYGGVTAVGTGRHDLRPGDIVELAHEGWYDSGQPRFARIVRHRIDLERHGSIEVVDRTGE